ncbi:unnamed protein product [Hyaloperonospora brassicae]|uniref:[Histone H3]-lysine(27) N-trimethyltransferase n=1 Tax=Hyaloperonospora brassicae TaxID=162125 RepID=A0AAV0U8W1_HYABA|nr:unnamed protein product [Hyaloperonospora brassicae]
MPSPSNSVILIDDSSDDDSVEVIGSQRQNRLCVHSSNESDGSDALGCQSEESHVPVVATSGASRDASGSRDSQLKEDKVQDIDEKGEGLVEGDSQHFDGGGAGDKIPHHLRAIDSGECVAMDMTSSGEVAAQQCERERQQGNQAHRACQPISPNYVRLTAAGSKRKASDDVPVSLGSKDRNLDTKIATSQSPFDFDCITISDDSSSLSSSEETSDATALGGRAKSMCLKDVVAQERELARLRTENAARKDRAAFSHVKKKAKLQAPASKSSTLSFGEQQNDGVKSSKFEQGDGKGNALSQSEALASLAIDLSSEHDKAEVIDETYTMSKRNKSSVRHDSGRCIDTGKSSKPKTTAKPKHAAKSESKKGKNKTQHLSAKPGVQPSATARAGRSLDKLAHHRTTRNTVIHSTAWRNVCFDSAPTNLLPLDSAVAAPFYSKFDRPLLTYDVDGDLNSKCKFVPQFGKSSRVDTLARISCEPEQVISQEEMDTRVSNLTLREQPRLRACQKRKTSAIVAEARAKVETYLAARAMLDVQSKPNQNRKRLVEGAVVDKLLLNQMKQEKSTQVLSMKYSHVWGEMSSVREKLLPGDVHQLPKIQPLSRCTAYIGLKANIRVEDDPILRHKPYFGDNDDGEDIDEAWYDAIEPECSSSVTGLDGEMNELILRLIVRECGTTESVFFALKSVLGFAQAYLDYSEMKKLDDGIGLAARRVEEARELIRRKPKEFPLARVVALETSLRTDDRCHKSLAERLAPPPTYFDSNLARNHSVRGYGLGLRAAADSRELLVTYRDMFCRMCYDYHCLEHGIEHPLPSHRVDPVNPPIYLSPVALAAAAKKRDDDGKLGDRSSESCTSTLISPANANTQEIGDCVVVNSFQIENKHSEDAQVDECVIIDDGLNETIDVNGANEEGKSAKATHRTRRSVRALTRCCTLASQSLNKQGTLPPARKQPRPHRVQLCPRRADESEYLDDSYHAHATAIFEKSLMDDERCMNECWKAGRHTISADPSFALNERKCDPNLLSDTELTLLRKLRAILGDNPCIISSIIKSTTCKEVGMVLESERPSSPAHGSAMNDVPLSSDAELIPNGRKRGRARDSRSRSNPISLERTRNNCLKGEWVNHEYEPCNHEGACDATRCSCMARDHTCDKACSCSRDCPNRFPGCKCSRGNCRTKACPCFIGARECNPDLCITCGASEVPALVFDKDRMKMSALDLGICCNVNILRGLHKKIGVAYSATHGWGAFALEPIKRGEFIYEYYGALLSQDEAERRGSIYDKMTISFLFDVDDDSVVDAIRKGNKSRFANHSTSGKNCEGKVLTVGSEHRISIWAQQDIAKGEELFFDYGYHGETAPDWSQLRIKGSMC